MLGVTSFLLVLYYDSMVRFSGALLTIVSSRVGDVIFLLTLSFRLGNEIYTSVAEVYVLGYFLIIRAITKSANIPFNAWLPAAIAAPTPVSALVHSSTLVTAGVYLLIRFHIFLSPETLNILSIFSGLTMIIASVAAVFEVDLKKVVALSTLSQCSLIILSVSHKIIRAAFIHLLCHSLFKARIFILIGCCIVLNSGAQDRREFISSFNSNPRLVQLFLISSLIISAIPFRTGFFSKEPILLANGSFTTQHTRLLGLSGLLSPITTVMYSARIFRSLGVFSKSMIRFNFLSLPFNCYKPILALRMLSVFFRIVAPVFFIHRLYIEHTRYVIKLILVTYPLMIFYGRVQEFIFGN